jgi:hypothetical protein
MTPERRELALSWLAKAESDLAYARLGMGMSQRALKVTDGRGLIRCLVGWSQGWEITPYASYPFPSHLYSLFLIRKWYDTTQDP